MEVDHWLGVAERMKGKVTSSQAENSKVRMRNNSKIAKVK